MKRKGKVVNASAYRAGRAAARWGATGMNWADGPSRNNLIAVSRAALADPQKLAAIGRRILAGHFGWTQSWCTAAVLGDGVWLAELRDWEDIEYGTS